MSIVPPNAETRELGTVGYVRKPFRRSEIEREIERALVPATC